MSMDGEILQRLRDHENRLKRLEERAGLLPPGQDAKTTRFIVIEPDHNLPPVELTGVTSEFRVGIKDDGRT